MKVPRDYFEAEKEAEKARQSRRAGDYFELCSEFGVEPLDDDLFMVGFLERSAEDEQLDAYATMSGQMTESARRYERDSRLVDYADVNPRVDVDNIRAHIPDKRNALSKILGYSGLRVGSGKGNFAPLEDCKPERIGRVFQKEVYAARKRLSPK